MNVSLSAEGIMNNHRGLSDHLHSFGAKIMLKLNKNIKYQINAPVNIMLNIFIKELPDSIWIGTKEMLELLCEHSEISLNTFKKINSQRIIEENIKKKMDKITKLNKGYNSFSEKIIELQETIEQIKENGAVAIPRQLWGNTIDKAVDELNDEIKYFQENNKETLDEISEINKRIEEIKEKDINDEEINKILHKEYQSYVDPYTYKGRTGKRVYSYHVLTEYPPILSIVVENGSKKFIIYEPLPKMHPDMVCQNYKLDKPIITITRNSTYRWMYTEAFRPAGKTNYVTIDYKKLANLKKIENPKL